MTSRVICSFNFCINLLNSIFSTREKIEDFPNIFAPNEWPAYLLTPSSLLRVLQWLSWPLTGENTQVYPQLPSHCLTSVKCQLFRPQFFLYLPYTQAHKVAYRGRIFHQFIQAKMKFSYFSFGVCRWKWFGEDLKLPRCLCLSLYAFPCGCKKLSPPQDFPAHGDCTVLWLTQTWDRV